MPCLGWDPPLTQSQLGLKRHKYFLCLHKTSEQLILHHLSIYLSSSQIFGKIPEAQAPLVLWGSEEKPNRVNNQANLPPGVQKKAFFSEKGQIRLSSSSTGDVWCVQGRCYFHVSICKLNVVKEEDDPWNGKIIGAHLGPILLRRDFIKGCGLFCSDQCVFLQVKATRIGVRPLKHYTSNLAAIWNTAKANILPRTKTIAN